MLLKVNLGLGRNVLRQLVHLITYIEADLDSTHKSHVQFVQTCLIGFGCSEEQKEEEGVNRMKVLSSMKDFKKGCFFQRGRLKPKGN